MLCGSLMSIYDLVSGYSGCCVGFNVYLTWCQDIVDVVWGFNVYLTWCQDIVDVVWGLLSIWLGVRIFKYISL